MGRARGLVSRWSALPLVVRDGALALVLTLTGQLEVLLAQEVEGPRPLQHLAFLLMTGSLVLRRRAALAATVIASVGLMWQTLLGSAPVASGFVALFVVGYSVATYEDRRRRSLLGLLALLAAILVYPLVEQTKLVDEVVNAMIPVSVWLLARMARERLDRAVRAERETLLQQRTEEERRSAALSAERRRIARELHDVVAHGVTLMLLQTEVLRGEAALPTHAQQHLDVVQDAGRRCLEDLRTLLLVLREDGPLVEVSATDLTPLLEQARATGTEVRLDISADVPPLPPTLGVAVYRLVQEALTNAVRHAPGAPVGVTITCGDGVLQVEVVDEGVRSGLAAPTGGSGAQLGLLGVRERLALHGGSVEAGPRLGGHGWAVRAKLPLPAGVPA